jgi:hypothetical protein
MCRICMDDLRNGTDVYETKCHHKFHKECLVDYCHNLHDEKYANFSSIKCPLCRTVLNCRIDNGDDMFPEIIHEDIPVKPIVVRALDIIDVDEYDLINNVDDISIDLNLTPEEKEEVFQEILRRKSLSGGKRRKHTKRTLKQKRKNKKITLKHRRKNAKKFKKKIFKKI